VSDTPTEFSVRDGRKRRYGLVYLDHIDRDSFRALSPAARLVYFALLPFVGSDTQQCWPKLAKLATIVGVSERTAWRSISALEDAGLISIGKLHFNRARRCNLYTLLEPPE